MRKTMLFAFLPVVLLACSGKEVTPDPTDEARVPVFQIAGEAQGTRYHITYISPNRVNYQPQISEILMHIDQSLSNWVEGSLLRQINDPASVRVEIKDTFHYLSDMFHMSEKVWELTNGDFDPTVMPLVNAWGYGYKEGTLPDKRAVDSMLEFIGLDRFSCIEPSAGTNNRTVFVKKDARAQLDFNAIAQGFSVDVICDFLATNGVKNFLVEIGGEVRCSGKNDAGNDWRIQIDKPVEGSSEHEQMAVVSIRNKAIATSGNYRKVRTVNGRKYSHTIHPKTGFPVMHSLLSVTLVADDCATADAYATAFMVAGPERAKALVTSDLLPDMEAYFIYQDENGTLYTWSTPGMKTMIKEETRMR